MWSWLLALSLLLGSWGLVDDAPDTVSGPRDTGVRTMDGGIIPPRAQGELLDGGIIPPG